MAKNGLNKMRYHVVRILSFDGFFLKKEPFLFRNVVYKRMVARRGESRELPTYLPAAIEKTPPVKPGEHIKAGILFGYSSIPKTFGEAMEHLETKNTAHQNCI